MSGRPCPRAASRRDRRAAPVRGRRWNRSSRVPDGGGHRQRLHGRRDVVHAHDRGAVFDREEMRGQRTAEPLHRFGRRDRVDEALARGADQKRQAEVGEKCAAARCRSMLCSAVLPKPMPGSSTMRSRRMPALQAISSEREKNSVTSATISIAGSARSRLCMMTTGAPCSATTRAMSGSRCRPHTSLTMAAPASSAHAATLALIVSIETGTPSATIGRSTGSSRCRSSSSDTGTAPPYGRVELRADIEMSAPSAARRSA